MNENYRKIKEIGKGGMSTVYLARQIPLNRLVAIKVLKTSMVSDKEYIHRFFREARITAQLNHPNIIQIIESNFSSEEKIFYIVTEYVEGGDFRNLLPPSTTAVTSTSPVGLPGKLEILHKVLLALDYAHQKGIVHRDVKPSNILLTKNLEPKLCDFGIATALWGQESRYTQTNEVIGTMDYIAPEQKENSKAVDLRADIYSIGVILYQVSTARKPLGAFPPPKQLVSSIPGKLSDIVMKCLQPLPIDRYKNAYNLSREIREVLSELERNGSVSVGEPKETEIDLTEISTPEDETETDETKIARRSGKFAEFDRMVEKLKKGTITEKLNGKTRFLEVVDLNHQERLLQLLQAPEPEVFLKETVIEALGKLKSKESCPYLIELLNDPYYNKASASAIGEIGCMEAEEKLFKILLERSEKSYIALLPLGKLNSVKSINLIAEYLTHRHTWVRELALEALAMITDKKVTGYLENISNKDPDANIRAKSKKFLWRLKQ